MRTISILPETEDSYRALAGDKESTGRTAGEALDALGAQLADEEGGTLIIVQEHMADEFFTAAQQERLGELMRLREVGSLAAEEEREFARLIETELDGARKRAEAIAITTEHDLAQTDAKRAEMNEILRRWEKDVDESIELIGPIIRQWVKDVEESDSLTLLKLWSDGMSIKEIAAALNISPAAASYKISRLNQMLFSHLMRRVLLRMNKWD